MSTLTRDRGTASLTGIRRDLEPVREALAAMVASWREDIELLRWVAGLDEGGFTDEEGSPSDLFMAADNLADDLEFAAGKQAAAVVGELENLP